MGGNRARIELFGDVVAVGSDGVRIRIPARKAALLFAYLSVHGSISHSREFLADLLWPDDLADTSRHNLRQALNTLRKSLEPIPQLHRSIGSDKQSIWINLDNVDVDFHCFEALMSKIEGPDQQIQSLIDAIKISKPEFLHGFYGDWIQVVRSQVEVNRLRTLRQLQDSLISLGDPQRALEFSILALAADPYSEELNLAAIRCFAESGLPEKVESAANSYRTLLESEIGILVSDQFSQQAKEFHLAAMERQRELRPRISLKPISDRIARISHRESLWLRAAALLFVMVLASSQPARQSDPLDSLDKFLTTASNVQGSNTDEINARKWRGIAATAFAEWYGQNEEMWVDKLEEVREELNKTLGWLLVNDPDAAVDICGKLTRYWYISGRESEGADWIRASLRSSKLESRGYWLAVVGHANLEIFQPEASIQRLQQAKSEFQKIEDHWGVAHATRHLALAYAFRNEYETAMLLYSEALKEFRALGDKRGEALTLGSMAYAPPPYRPDELLSKQQLEWAKESYNSFKKIGNLWGIRFAGTHYRGLLAKFDRAAADQIQLPPARKAAPASTALGSLLYEVHHFDVAKNPNEFWKLMAKALEWCADDHGYWDISTEVWNVVRNPKFQSEADVAKILGGLASLDRQLGVRADQKGELARIEILNEIAEQIGKKKAKLDYEAGKGLSPEAMARLASRMILKAVQ